MTRKHPFGVTLLLWMVLCLSAWGMLRFLATLRWWEVLVQFDARLSPWYLAITGIAWTMAGLLLIWSIWKGRRWAYPALIAALFLWLVEYWLERIFFQEPRANQFFMIVVSLVMVAIILLILFNRNTRDFLLRSEEHEQSDQDPTSA